jgi:8-oxo-dGTP diphosphatase
VVLVTGILERGAGLLLVASRYPNHALALWNLPGGRRREGELLEDALRREFLEETGLTIEPAGLRYVSESYDPVSATHFLNVTFTVTADGEPSAADGDAHVVGFAWVPRAELASRLQVRVVREPLLGHLADPTQRYFAFADAGVTIAFADEA